MIFYADFGLRFWCLRIFGVPALLVLDDLIVIARGRGDKADEESIFSG